MPSFKMLFISCLPLHQPPAPTRRAPPAFFSIETPRFFGWDDIGRMFVHVPCLCGLLGLSLDSLSSLEPRPLSVLDIALSESLSVSPASGIVCEKQHICFSSSKNQRKFPRRLTCCCLVIVREQKRSVCEIRWSPTGVFSTKKFSDECAAVKRT